jgi:hypothetical protein
MNIRLATLSNSRTTLVPSALKVASDLVGMDKVVFNLHKTENGVPDDNL